ncbi:hypothetical protein [Aquabacterium sp. OR-4]|uniref:hypothetical protein n=1 Tax=Aquabacterium sp. OR-4 TaxID=2978127 RepID=UPI0028C6829B|nr:hypothetical protein [Aquabacterium sp. OR-4]MDT7834672.1 hypothetical protein [Aquabacterium sp. OR-4]
MTTTATATPGHGPAARQAGLSRVQRFFTLMRREWLQHRIGWCVLLVAPTALMLVLGVFDRSLIQVQLDDESFMVEGLHQAPAVLQALLLGLGLTAATVVLALLSLGFQLPGLARRDVQDRSIEFWRSMPSSHSQSLAATLLMHVLVLPWAALLAGALGSQLVALTAVVSAHGLGAWFDLPWTPMLAAGAALLLRAAWGLLLAALWLSPLILLTMAASAWLKRWGVPVVVAVGLAAVHLLDPRLPQPWFRPALNRLMREVVSALMTASPLQGAHVAEPAHIVEWLPDLPAWALRDAGAALAHLASPAFVLALALGGLGFALLVWRRHVG